MSHPLGYLRSQLPQLGPGNGSRNKGQFLDWRQAPVEGCGVASTLEPTFCAAPTSAFRFEPTGAPGSEGPFPGGPAGSILSERAFRRWFRRRWLVLLPVWEHRTLPVHLHAPPVSTHGNFTFHMWKVDRELVGIGGDDSQVASTPLVRHGRRASMCGPPLHALHHRQPSSSSSDRRCCSVWRTPSWHR